MIPVRVYDEDDGQREDKVNQIIVNVDLIEPRAVLVWWKNQ